MTRGGTCCSMAGGRAAQDQDLEAELDAGFETGEVKLEGGGDGGVGIVADSEAGEAVAEVKAYPIVGEAGGDTEVDLVVVLILRVFDLHFAL